MSPIQDQDHRPLLLQGPSLGLRLAVLVAAALGLMVADHRGDYLSTLRSAASAAAYPLHWAVHAPFSGWDSVSRHFVGRATLEAENSSLRSENQTLKLRQLRFEALERENERLREARESSSRVVQRSLVAGIMRINLDPFRQRVLVNKGARDGVFRGQAALDANGVFGQVTRVGPVTAEIIMISDPEHAIPVQVNRTGVRTIAVGLGQPDVLSLPFLPRNADLEEGDLVVSSGLGGVFPPGYPVARIAELRRDPAQPLLVVSATPMARLDRDSEVLLVWFDATIPEPEAEAEAETAAPVQPADETAAPASSAPVVPADATAPPETTSPVVPPVETTAPRDDAAPETARPVVPPDETAAAAPVEAPT